MELIIASINLSKNFFQTEAMLGLDVLGRLVEVVLDDVAVAVQGTWKSLNATQAEANDPRYFSVQQCLARLHINQLVE